MTEIEHLFVEVKRVIERSAAEQKERRERGELFNIFDVLNVSTSEVRTHSAFLAELLNPKGSHGLGSYPLACFKVVTDKFHPLDFDLNNAVVHKERPIGRIDDDYNTGGQVDIIVESGNQAIIIENKIYAGDQKKQLLRYYRYAKRYSSFVLLYLTLDGHLPQRVSYEDNLIPGKDFYCISYKEHIIGFLDLIMTKAFDKPLVRETTIQYKHLLEELTHSTMDNKNKDELLKMMFCHSNCAVEIINCRDDFLNKAVEDHLIPQIVEIAKNNHLSVSDSDILSKKKWKEGGMNLQRNTWSQIMIRLEFDENNWRGFFIGVCWKDYLRKGDKRGNPLSCLEDGNDLWVGGCRYLNPRTLDYSSIPYIINKTNENSYYRQIDSLIKSIIKEITDSGREA